MKRLLVIPLAVLLLCIVGCPSTPILPPVGGVIDNGTPVAIDLERGLWLKGGEVSIKNLYPGYTGEMEFEVGNGLKDDMVREVHVSVAPEDDQDLGGWEQLPGEYYSWFTIDNPVFILQPGESQTVTVTVRMPVDADYSQKKARCELLVTGWAVLGTTLTDGEATNEVGNVPIGLASEWYIETY